MRRLNLLTIALCALPLDAQQPGDRLLVCNKAEHTLSIFDVVDGHEVARLGTGVGPHEVAVSADGHTAVVTDYGTQKPGHTLTVVDVVAAKVLRTIDLPRPGEDRDKKFLRPHGVQFVSAHDVVVTSETTRRLLRVDVRAGAVEASWPTGQPSMHMVSVATGGRHAAATSVVDGTVTFFDLARPAGDLAPAPIATGKGAEGMAVHPVTGDAWVANRADDTLAIVSAKQRKIIATLATGSVPFRVAFTPDGAHVLVTCAESGELMIFNTARRTLLREVSIHGDRSEQSSLPLGVVTGSDGRRAYVACARGEFVAVVDLQKAEVVDRIDTRKGPDGIAYARPSTAADKR
ncbi:MAG: YncE family protein [Planctomycetota bacterium]